MLKIRQGIASDAAALTRMAETAFRDTFSAVNSASDMDLYCASSFQPDIQRQELEDDRIVTLLAEFETELVGFAQLRLHSSSDCAQATCPAEIYRFYVTSDWHGQGVAQKIMQQVFAAAFSAQSDVLWLGVWEHNPRAIAFYRKSGFEIAGEQFFQLGNDRQRDLVMVVQVDDASMN